MVLMAEWLTLEDYFQYANETDQLYELEDGIVRSMPPERDINRRITMFLISYFLRCNLHFSWLSQKTEVVVSGTRATVRLPDLVVLSDELVELLDPEPRSTITLDMPPPPLVIEVVSPGKQNEDRDYRYKRSQYESRGIDEYWIVDPMKQQVTVFTLREGLYDETCFTGNAELISPFLQHLTPAASLTADQILQTKG